MARSEQDDLKAFRRVLGKRMDDLRRDREMDVKTVCTEMGWHKSEYSRKYRGETPLMDHEVVRLRRLLRATSPWPYVSIEEGLLLAALGMRTSEVLRRLSDINKILDGRSLESRTRD